MPAITLHGAAEQVRALLDQIDAETGALPDGFEEARALVASRAVAVVAYVLETERQAADVAAYVREVSARLKTAERRIEWLRTYLGEHMNAAGITEIKDERGIFKASLQRERDEAVEIFDEAQLPADYLREVPARYEPDKALVKRALKDGYDVPGARLVLRDRLTIR